MSNFLQSVQQSAHINSVQLNSYQIEQMKRNDRHPLANGQVRRYASINDAHSSSLHLIKPDPPRSHDISKDGIGWSAAAFLLVNTALGAGMLHYPYAYNQIGGVLNAALMQVVSLMP